MGAVRGPYSAAVMGMAGGMLTPGMVVPPVVRDGMFSAFSAIGEGVSSLLSTAGDVAEWKSDAEILYGTLALEGLGFLYDVYVKGEEGSGAIPIAEAWDKRINGMAHAHAKFSLKHQFGAMAPLNGLALWFAGNDETKQMLLRHYLWAQGKPCDLSRLEMEKMPAFIDFFDTVERKAVIKGKEKMMLPYSEHLKSAVDDAKQGRSTKVKTVVKGSSAALGNFAVIVEGTVKPGTGPALGPTVSPNPIKDLANPGVPLTFDGRMRFKDLWDFDSKVAPMLSAPGSTGRPGTAEAAVAAVAALVDGVPFDVTSDEIPVIQHSGHAPIY